MFTEANVTVMVSDLDRAVQFYTEVLGLTLKRRAGDGWAEIEAPGLTIGLHPASAHGPQPGQAGSLSIGFGVTALEPVMAALQAKEVVFAPHISEDGPVRLAFFSDPDRNPLYLSAPKQG
jgi:catechol 2,3-dioxygenase-like lactoylglutathione lyase family enzyme